MVQARALYLLGRQIPYYGLRDSITSTPRARDDSVQTTLIRHLNILKFKRISRDTEQHC